MAQYNKIELENIQIQSFITTLSKNPSERLRGGISAGDCQFSQALDCTVEPGCTDENRCEPTGCCAPRQV